MTEPVDLRRILCFLVAQSRCGFTMKEYRFYQDISLSGMYVKMLDGLNFPETSFLQDILHAGSTPSSFVQRMVDRAIENKDLSEVYGLLGEIKADEKMLALLRNELKRFYLQPNGLIILDYPNGSNFMIESNSKTTPAEYIKQVIGEPDDIEVMVSKAVGKLKHYITHHASQLELLNILGMGITEAELKFPMTSLDRQITKFLTALVRTYLKMECANKTVTEEAIEINLDFESRDGEDDFIIGEINLRPGFDPDPRLIPFLEDHERVLELIQTHACPSIWGKFFRPTDVLLALNNRYKSETEEEVTMENVMKPINLHGMDLEKALELIQNALPEAKDMFVIQLPDPEVEVLEGLLAKIESKTLEGNNKVYPQDINEIMQDLDVFLQKYNHHSLLAKLGGMITDNPTPEALHRMQYLFGLLSATTYISTKQRRAGFVNNPVGLSEQLLQDVTEKLKAIFDQKPNTIEALDMVGKLASQYGPAVVYTSMYAENPHPDYTDVFGAIRKYVEQSTAHSTSAPHPMVSFLNARIKECITEGTDRDTVIKMINEMVQTHGPRMVYMALTGFSEDKVSGDTDKLKELINSMVRGMFYSTIDENKELATKLQQIVTEFCCQGHFVEQVQTLVGKHGAEQVRDLICLHDIGGHQMNKTNSAEADINSWGERVITAVHGAEMVAPPSFDRTHPTGDKFIPQPNYRFFGVSPDRLYQLGRHLGHLHAFNSHPNGCACGRN